MSTNEYYAVEILPEKVCNFDFIENCLIFEIDDNKYKKRSKLVKLYTLFFISNLVAKAPGLSFGKKLSNLLRNRKALN